VTPAAAQDGAAMDGTGSGKGRAGAGPTGSRERVEDAVLAKYRGLAAGEGASFPYATGREGARRLGYGEDVLDALPDAVARRFVGVGDPFEIREPRPGERVLDVGCGSGADVRIAGRLVGARGLAVGVDLSEELVRVARGEGPATRASDVRVVRASAEALPFRDGAFDHVLSNGALNLVFDKERAFREIARVLRPGGTLAIADLLVVATVPDHVLADMDAWST
jgi:arsenite methyltransferase